MGKQDFNKGMEAGAKPFEEKFQKLSEDNRKIGDKVNEKLDSFGNIIDAVMDDLSDMQKNELYHLNTPYDLKEDLDDDEKEILAALLLRLSEYTENNEYQKKFMRSVNVYIGVKSPQTGLDISCIENIENINSQKIILQAAMEYLYLMTEDFSFLEELEEEVFEHFSVNRKVIREIEGYIQTIDQATGKDGIAEKYGYVPEEKTREGTIDEDTFKLYQETTPYDLMTDISEEEAHVLGGLLSKSAADEANEYQKMFINMLEDKAEINLNPGEDEEINLDLLEKMDSQKIILQVLMEYGFLGTGNFNFWEKEIFDDFSVNKRGVRQIKDCIQKVYDLKGYEGIIEKYKYMGVEEEGKEEEEEIGESLEISQVCADRVNAHKYVELDKYLVYEDENIYKVHKQTGERSVVWENPFHTFCGTGKKIYINKISKNEILEINVDSGAVNKIEAIYQGNSNWDKITPICNRGHLVYNTVMQNGNAIVHVDLKTYSSSVLANNNNIPFYSEQLFLLGNRMYILPGGYGSNLNEDTLYKYNLSENKLEEVMVNKEYGSLMRNCRVQSSLSPEDNLLILYDFDDGKLSLVCIDLNDIEKSDKWEVNLGDKFGLDFCYDSWIFGKNIITITEEEEGQINLYNVVEKSISVIVEESKGVHSYTSGLIFKSSCYSMDIEEMQLIGDNLYYKTEEATYKISIKKKNHSPERL